MLCVLQQELAAIFKKIGDKQTCTIGLYELYRITQLYPKALCFILFSVNLFDFKDELLVMSFCPICIRLIYLLSCKMLVRHSEHILEMV